MMSKRGTALAVENAVCTFCGCTCDDIRARAEGGRIVEAQRACTLGQEWFGGQPVENGPSARVEGRPATLDEAIDAAAKILSTARSPLVYGLLEASGEAQAAAVGVADLLGATLDTPSSATREWALAFQQQGVTSATLGELKNRADLLVLWNADPERSHPRFFERFVRPAGLYVSGPRTVIALAEAGSKTSSEADRTIRIPPDRAFEVLWALRTIVQGQRLGTDAEGAVGLKRSELEKLAAKLTGCGYGAWIYDPNAPPTRSDPAIAQATLALVRALNEHVPFAVFELGGRGNSRGAESVVTAQTGYPFAVSFARGYPRFGPGEFTAPEMLTRGEIDAVLVLGCDPSEHLPEPALRALEQLPIAAVDFRDSELARRARVAIRVATYGIAAPATVYRMDGVALRAQPALSTSLPSDADVLRRLADRLSGLGTAGSGRS